MTNEFIVSTAEIFLLDESGFLDRGGEELHFGALEGPMVRLHVSGSPSSIRNLASTIIAHRTACG